MVAVMKFRLYDCVHEFYELAYPLLARHEAQNMVMLGNLIIGKKGEDKHGWRDAANWLMAAVFEGDELCLAALATPPWNITLCSKDDVANEKMIEYLVNGLLASELSVPGVVAENDLAQAFASKYCDLAGLDHEVKFSQRIFELTEVSPKIPKIGDFRLSRASDLSFLPYWLEEFGKPMGTSNGLESDTGAYQYFIDTGKLHVLEVDGTAVSIAGITRETETAVCVGRVYTPPYFRGKGYASSVVAQLSQLYLDKGYKFCVLYTDLANPTSNKIYQEIGYKAVCDSLEIKFKEE